MNIIFYLKLYVLTVPVFFAVDMIWLGFIAKNFYRNNLGFILSPDVNWPAAISFYLLYIVGIIIFAVLPALEKESLGQGAVVGLFVRFFHLCHIRFDKYGHHKELAAKGCNG